MKLDYEELSRLRDVDEREARLNAIKQRARQIDRFMDFVAQAVGQLEKNYGTRSSYIVRASAEMTCGVTELTLVCGEVRVESVLGNKKCFEIREA